MSNGIYKGPLQASGPPQQFGGHSNGQPSAGPLPESVPPDQLVPPMPPPAPLSQPQYQAINQSLRMLSQIREQIQRAQAARVPCDQQNELCNFLTERLNALKSTYFPNQS
jgi:hypothetical protein